MKSKQADVRKLELLAPAKNAEIGIAAINHGADAVYIGGPAFGARSAAGNSLAELERLVRHAHLFHARVYIALNTLFEENELERAAALAHDFWNLGADALIVQDMGLLECDLPPIPLHASTQCDTRTPEKAAFLEAVGFRQIVLARELNLQQIGRIRAATTVPLEFFIHGALCVSYSGQCYISEVLQGRSANRGECAQFCRHRYTLRRENGEQLADGYLLSLQDLNLSGRLAALAGAGISSFKIEGRLKDENYVKNVTASYRRELDALLEQGGGSVASSGRCLFDFVPNLDKSFHRGGTDYYIETRRNCTAEIHTPKATGEALGVVAEVRGNAFRLENPVVLANGDGLCCFDRHGDLQGMRINRVDREWVSLKEQVKFTPGTEIFRNRDVQFNRELERSETPRTIGLSMSLRQNVDGLLLELVDEDGLRSESVLTMEFELAKQPGQGERSAKKQLARLGDSFFRLENLSVELEGNPFLPAALLNDLRRKAVAAHEELRREEHPREEAAVIRSGTPWLSPAVSVLDNIRNSRAVAFYRRHGAEVGGELDAKQVDGMPLMQTKYCVKYQLGLCPHEKGSGGIKDSRLILADQTGEKELEFDCQRCEMVLRQLR